MNLLKLLALNVLFSLSVPVLGDILGPLFPGDCAIHSSFGGWLFRAVFVAVPSIGLTVIGTALWRPPRPVLRRLIVGALFLGSVLGAIGLALQTLTGGSAFILAAFVLAIGALLARDTNEPKANRKPWVEPRTVLLSSATIGGVLQVLVQAFLVPDLCKDAQSSIAFVFAPFIAASATVVIYLLFTGIVWWAEYSRRRSANATR